MVIKDWKSLYKSTLYFLKLIFISKKYDVVFVSSSNFNRGINGENILLKPMIDICINNNLKYIVFEDTNLKGLYKNEIRSKSAIPIDFISFVQIILRKIHNIKYEKPRTLNQTYFQELKISRILKKLFFRKLYSKVYITLLWNNVTLWRCINPSSCIVDYQHGIIFDGHIGYINDKSPPKIKSDNDIITFVYGEWFKNLLITSDNTKFYSKKNVINIGLNKYSEQKKISFNNKKILFTLQLVADFEDKSINKSYINIIEKLIAINEEYLSKNDYHIIFKHHPRYSSDDFLDLSSKYDFVSFDNKTTMKDILETVSLHITFNSTSAIDAALVGVPTVFINMHEQFSPDEIFLKQYNYPFQHMIVKDFYDLGIILKEIEDEEIYKRHSHFVYSWANELYDDFNETVFKEFILNKINDA